MGTGGGKIKRTPKATVEGTARADFRDYAFAPGETEFDEAMREVLALRPQTILISDPLIDSLASFLRALRTSPLVTHPIHQLLIASHANPEGLLQIPLDLVTPKSTYESLDAVRKSGSIRIHPKILTTRPKNGVGKTIPAALHVKGCRIGSQVPFLYMLKEALGGGLQVTAPKHFHAAAELTAPAGRVEYMDYSFTINRPGKFGKGKGRARARKEAIKEFADHESFTLIDEAPIPESRWDEWIPRNIHGTKKEKKFTKKMESQFVNPVTEELETGERAQYRYRRRTLFKGSRPSVGLSADPRTYEGRKRAVQDALVRELARYRPDYGLPGHPFPEYVRLGYPTMDAFMDGWKWTFTWRARDKTLFYNAIRHEYTVVRPIVDPATNRLFMNFYPSSSTSAPLVELREDDPRFFETV